MLSFMVVKHIDRLTFVSRHAISARVIGSIKSKLKISPTDCFNLESKMLWCVSWD